MKIPPLTIVPAGAGSGKTHKIQTTLSQWIMEGKVKPEKIIAVTFTEAAAGELQERIRAELVKHGRLDEALKLQQAYIGTIHGFGLRLLTEYAFDVGISPKPRKLNEDEQKVLISRLLAKTDKADAVMSNLYSFGYKWEKRDEKDPEIKFREKILELIELLRSIGRVKEDQEILLEATQKIKNLYGNTRPASTLNSALHQAVKELFKNFPDTLSTRFPGNKTAVNELDRDFRNLNFAKDLKNLECNWELWQQLRELRQSKRGSALPEEYDNLTTLVMNAAHELLDHPGPLDQALIHAKALLGTAMDSIERYGQYKREKGLLDYTDMVADTAHLVLGNEEVLNVFREFVDCAVIDEFQDTNPLQFSLLWALFQTGIPTLVVGDTKQSIMGFQGADPRLMKALQEKFSSKTDPLPGNWRSTPKIMKFINKVGDSLFGKNYTHLKPMANFKSVISPFDVIRFSKRGNNCQRALYTAIHIKNLLDDEKQMVFDRNLKALRRLRPGDIAILCPTRGRQIPYAEALLSLGVRSRKLQDGWFESRIIQVLYQALSYVADPNDKHAALYLAVTEYGSFTLQDAITGLMSDGTIKEPLLGRLQGVIDGARDKGVDVLVGEAIEALDLYGITANEPESNQIRANILRFQGEAREFLSANREVLASGGFYGSGLKTFLSWLKDKVERENNQPQARVIDEEAVEITTWHSAKGKEWPVVAVCASDYEMPLYLPNYNITYDTFGDLSQVLDKARVEVTPKFAAKEKNEVFKAPLMEKEEDTARNLWYVALTRAREKIILEWPDFVKESSCYWNVLKDSSGIALNENKVQVGQEEFECCVIKAGQESAPEIIKSTGVSGPLPGIGRRAIKAANVPENLTPESLVPSSFSGTECIIEGDITQERYGEFLSLGLEISGAELGTLLHNCFEILSGKKDNLSLIKQATGYDLTDDQLSAIGDMVSCFDSWVKKRFSPISIGYEVPFLMKNAQGSVVTGDIDMLLETEKGFWIIDHKSDKPGNMEEHFKYYFPQLKAYHDAVRSAGSGKPVLGVGIHWIFERVVMGVEV